MRLDANDNKGAIRRLAQGSIRSNPLRTFFIICTIVLSVSLLMVMGLFQSGYVKAKERRVEHMQHIIYMKTSPQQTEMLKANERVSEVLLYKAGQGMELDSAMIQPVYSERPEKGANMQGVKLSKGEFPKGLYEAAVSEQFLEKIGEESKIGITFELTFLDGVTETFTVSGLLKSEGKMSIYPIHLSELYAKTGSQLKDVSYDTLAQIHNPRQYNQSGFEEELYAIGADAGIERKNMNINNHFLDSLPGGVLQGQQQILIIGISVGLLFISVLVIYSVFYLSVIGRIRQFGQLRTIGMTKRQIRSMVRWEGLLLSAMGIPAGILTGGLIGYFIQPMGWDWKSTLVLALIVAASDILTVLFSIRRPAQIAAAVSPIEASKYIAPGYKDEKKEIKQLKRKLSPVHLARLQATRNRKKTVMTMISLGIGGMLFMTAAAFATSTNLEEYSRQTNFRYGEFELSLSYNAAKTAEHGLIEIQMQNPLSDELKSELESLNGVKQVLPYAAAEMTVESNGEVQSGENITGFDQKKMKEMSAYLEEGELDYEKLVKGDQIVICSNETVEEIYGWRYRKGDKIVFTTYNGTEEVTKVCTVGAMVGSEYRKINPTVGWYLMPQSMLDEIMGTVNLNSDFIISTENGKTKDIERQLTKLIEVNPLLTLSTLRENMEENEASFARLFITILGLAAFIIGFSLLNLINTLITNIVTRKQELAALQSIGMTGRQLSQMIQCEGLILALGNGILTLLLGSAAGYGMVKILRHFGADYMHYTFPLWFYLGYLVLILLVPVIVAAVIIRNFKKQPLVDRLRVVD